MQLFGFQSSKGVRAGWKSHYDSGTLRTKKQINESKSMQLFGFQSRKTIANLGSRGPATMIAR
jgi:hypothetical protein